jgi:hypothetical protein
MTTTLERVQALTASIAAAAPEIEAARSVPDAVVDALKAAGGGPGPGPGAAAPATPTANSVEPAATVRARSAVSGR